MPVFPHIQLKRMINRNSASPFPMATQEGQIRYDREGAVDGELYLARRNSAGTMEWQPFVQVNVSDNDSQEVGDTASTASTTIYATAMTRSITLPQGTWTVRANGWITLIHSASLKATFRVKVDGTAGNPTTTENLSNTLYTMWGDAGSKTGVVGGAAIDVVLEYHSSGAGTTSAANCLLWITATRTS